MRYRISRKGPRLGDFGTRDFNVGSIARAAGLSTLRDAIDALVGTIDPTPWGLDEQRGVLHAHLEIRYGDFDAFDSPALNEKATPPYSEVIVPIVLARAAPQYSIL